MVDLFEYRVSMFVAAVHTGKCAGCVSMCALYVLTSKYSERPPSRLQAGQSVDLYGTCELVCDRWMLNCTSQQLNAGRTLVPLFCLTESSSLSASFIHTSLPATRYNGKTNWREVSIHHLSYSRQRHGSAFCHKITEQQTKSPSN